MLMIDRKQARQFILRKQGLLGNHRFIGKDGAYQYIRQAIALSKIKEPNRVILFHEDFGNHDGKVAIAFVDGHVMSYSVDGCETIEELSEHHKLLLKAVEK